MNSSFKRSFRIAPALLAITTLNLAACSSTPDRGDEPPRGGDRQDRPARTSGTFIQPAALLFADMDSNKDKVTTRDELMAGVQAEWESFDRNPSAITFASWSVRALGSTDANPTFMSFDRDFNGVISKSEWSEQFDTLFTRLDKDGNGALERSEMIVAFAAPQGRRQQGGERGERGERGGGRGGGGRPPR